MTWTELLANAGFVAVGMAALALVEGVIPLVHGVRRGRTRVAINLGLAAQAITLNALLTGAAVVLARRFELEGCGLLASLSAHPFLLVALAIPVLDLATYWAHRTMHMIPALWTAHRVHHADAFVDVTTTLRQHPLELVWRFLWVIVPTWLIGIPVAALASYRLLSVAQGLLEHANVDLGARAERALAPLVITPNAHKLHHSPKRAEHDRNYGNLFSALDRLFGSYLAPDRDRRIEYGLADTVRSAHGARAVGAADLERSQ
jgi:sterol desaturase/sphingolipid hydroxylase (fatty acid hydroxylase superfamily)